MSRKEENRNMETLTTSELCSNSLPSCLPGNGKVECWPRAMRKIAAAKAGNMAIPFQSDLVRSLLRLANRVKVMFKTVKNRVWAFDAE